MSLCFSYKVTQVLVYLEVSIYFPHFAMKGFSITIAVHVSIHSSVSAPLQLPANPELSKKLISLKHRVSIWPSETTPRITAFIIPYNSLQHDVFALCVCVCVRACVCVVYAYMCMTHNRIRLLSEFMLINSYNDRNEQQ
jgi:hypothetical protein